MEGAWVKVKWHGSVAREISLAWMGAGGDCQGPRRGMPWAQGVHTCRHWRRHEVDNIVTLQRTL
jgi:hypothetical protein